MDDDFDLDFQGLINNVFVGDILRGIKGLILNIIFYVFIKSTVLYGQPFKHKPI